MNLDRSPQPRSMIGLIGRRTLLLGTSAVAGLYLASGCDRSPSESPSPGGDGSDEPNAAQEAPMLAQRVESGELPPLEDRLPENPLVVEPTDRLGVYGGTWNTAIVGPTDTAWVEKTIGYDPLLRWDPEWTTELPNVAEAVEASADGREFTIALRKGMKWSDGMPFNADDLVFYYEDVLGSVELTPSFPSWLAIGDEPSTLEKVDDHTVRIVFTQPNGMFRMRLAYQSRELVAYPRHYLQEFHLAYNPDVEAVAQDEGFDGWAQLFAARADMWANKELPRLHAWVITTELGESSQVVAERNPYYWKVDPDGRQLPYLDQVIYDVAADEEVILLKATNGELSLHLRHITVEGNKPVLAENRETGDYDFLDLTPGNNNRLMVMLNLAHQNDVLREIFQNKDFRVGLSHAINRQEIIDVVYQRQGQAWQAAPRPEYTAFYDEQMAKQYTEYDVDLANEHLDRAGYTERDGDGFRLGPDGARIRFSVEVATGFAAWTDSLELINGYWRDVGIDMQVQAEDRSLFYERKAANEHDAGVWGGTAGLRDAVLDPRFYFPFSDESTYAIPWARWFNDGSDPKEEPPEAAIQQMELYRQLEITIDPDEQIEIFRQILQIAKEQFYLMGITLTGDNQGKQFGVIKNNFRNVLNGMTNGNVYFTPGPSNPEQYFISDDT